MWQQAHASPVERPSVLGQSVGWAGRAASQQRAPAQAVDTFCHWDLIRGLDAPSGAGSYAARLFTAQPTSPELTLQSPLFRALLLRGSACHSRSPQPAAAAASYMMHAVTTLQRPRVLACCARVSATSSERLRGSCNAYILEPDLDRRIEVIANGLPLCNPGVAVDGCWDATP